MAAVFLIFLLVATGGAAAVGDDGATLPHLQLRGTTDPGREHASDAPPKGSLMDIMSMNGCGRFASLVATTPNTSETFERRFVAGGTHGVLPRRPRGGGVRAQARQPKRRGPAHVLLHHGATARYGREQIAAFESVEVRMLAFNKSLALTVRDDGDTVSLWPSSGRYGAAATVTKAISSDDSPLAVYVVDAVLLPSHVRQLLDGEAAPSGGYLGWLNYTIPVWVGLCWAVLSVVSFFSGMVTTAYYCSHRPQ